MLPRNQSIASTLENVDAAGSGGLTGASDGQIVDAVSIEVAGDQRLAETVVCFVASHAGLVEATPRHQPGFGSRESEDVAGVRSRTERFSRRADSQITIAVAVEIAHRNGPAEFITELVTITNRFCISRPLACFNCSRGYRPDDNGGLHHGVAVTVENVE